MAHFAKLNKNNIVVEVLVLENKVITNKDGIEVEELGAEFLKKLTGHSNWKQTSYSGSFRGIYAGIGTFYDLKLDKFVSLDFQE
jgi:hypothetical protein